MKKVTLAQKIGIVLIILGVIVMLSALPSASLSTVSVGNVTISDISEVSAVKIGVGAILLLFGVAIFFGRTVAKKIFGK